MPFAARSSGIAAAGCDKVLPPINGEDTLVARWKKFAFRRNDMGERNPDSEVPSWIPPLDLTSGPTLPDRHAAGLLLNDLDYDQQLMAITDMLRRNKEYLRTRVHEIEDLETKTKSSTGSHNDFLSDQLIDEYHSYTYEDGAQSMAAVGMLAPFVESMFYQAFQRLRTLNLPLSCETHERWSRAAPGQWDCRIVWEGGRRRTNVVRGILQLAEATQLGHHLPGDLDVTLGALFAYRNMMFHHGIEWPKSERDGFAKRISEAAWPTEWFAGASSGGDPWMFYMTDVFIEHVLKTTDEIIEGIGAYCNKHYFGGRPSSCPDRQSAE